MSASPNFRITLFLLAIVWGQQLLAQPTFDCNGKMYRVIEKQGGSVLEEIILNDDGDDIAFAELASFFGTKINGISYHPTQNLIYGITLGEKYKLCRINADYQLEILRDLELPDTHIFVSGDFSPDEKYLVLLGFSASTPTNLLVLIDVTKPDYPVEILPLLTTHPELPFVYCADIAFHPTTNELYGFDHYSGRLITISIEDQKIDNSSYPVSEVLKGNVPSIFFNAKGKLYGIGAPSEVVRTNRRFYEFLLETGEIIDHKELRFEGNQDACSCPYTLDLLNKVNKRLGTKCTELIFDFTIINRTGKLLKGITFTDTFPDFSRIIEISELPFVGIIKEDTKDHIITITSIDLPSGIYTFSIKIDIPENAPEGLVQNQAYLHQVNESFDLLSETILSDDPETSIIDDPTNFEIQSLNPSFVNQKDIICEDETLILETDIPDAATYHWSTGDETSSITISEPGYYDVTVTTDCEQNIAEIIITSEEITVDLGEDETLELGAFLIISPEITSDSEIRIYHWQENPGSPMMCTSCAEMSTSPQKDTEYTLIVENESGCKAMDKKRITVTRYEVFASNIFSPNGDGQNDLFYLMGKNDYYILEFQIYDRWGNQTYFVKNQFVNDTKAGWDGTFKGSPSQAGVYLWAGKLITISGEEIFLTGDVTLMR